MTDFATAPVGDIELDDAFIGLDEVGIGDGLSAQLRKRDNHLFEVILQEFPAEGSTPPLGDGDLIDTAAVAEYLDPIFLGGQADGLKVLNLRQSFALQIIATANIGVGEVLVRLEGWDLLSDGPPLFSVSVPGLESGFYSGGTWEWTPFKSGIGTAFGLLITYSGVAVGGVPLPSGDSFGIAVSIFAWEDV